MKIMISTLAREAYEKFIEDGLKPTLDDLVYLNALGLRVEKGPDVYSFGSVPRASFLGDNILWEPTLKKRIWMDEMNQLLADKYLTKLSFTAYALHLTDDEIFDVKDIGDLTKKVSEFSESVLIHFTETQIVAAIEYALVGNDWRTNEEYRGLLDDEVKKVYDFPQEEYSHARQILTEALGDGLKDPERLRLPTLERMILLRAIKSGVQTLKDIGAQDTGKFYSAVGMIRTRLTKEKRDRENGKV